MGEEGSEGKGKEVKVKKKRVREIRRGRKRGVN